MPCWTRRRRLPCRCEANRICEPVGAADRDGLVLAAIDRIPAEGGGDTADALRVEDVDGTTTSAVPAGQLEHVSLGCRAHHWTWVVEDQLGEQAGLARARWRHDQSVLLDRNAQPMTVVRHSKQEGVVVRVGESLPRRKRTTRPVRPAESRNAAPAQVQLNDRRVAATGMQAEQQT